MRISTASSCWIGLGLLLILSGCVEPYTPAVVDAPSKYLVVDGFINGNGITRIKLSRTENIATTTPPPVEKGAQLFIVDDAGARYTFSEKASGSYESDSLALNAARRYQLRIITGMGSTAATYESDFTPLKVTPPIDKFDWVRQDSQVQLRLSTHDPTGQSRYYRWRYSETWQFNSAYQSVLEFRGGIVQDRITPIYTCWRTEQPSTIRHTSTASLSKDAIVDLPLASFTDRAERFKIRYSILVIQYAETAEEFAYLDILRKNTEALGTVNDPLPSQLTGNVHRVGTSTNEPVLGFVSAHTLQQKRIFITPQDLGIPPLWAFEDPYATCTTGVELTPDPGDRPPNLLYAPHTRIFADPANVPIDFIGLKGDSAGYYGSSRECVDCRTRGSNVKPIFW
jgi:hypothetical protein